MGKLLLEIPTNKYEKKIKEFIKEFIYNRENNFIEEKNLNNIKNLNRMFKEEDIELLDDSKLIPSTTFLALRELDNKIVACIKINHYLNEKLLNEEGHLEINICPTENNRDNIVEVINLALLKCREFDIGRVFIYCHQNDILLKKAIKEKGGILVDEMILSNRTIKQRYCISLKKRYGNRHKQNKPNSNLIYIVENFKEETFNLDVSFYDFKDADIKIVTPKGKIIIDNNYKLLEFYDYNSKVKLSAFYDNNNEIIEWYFDIAKEIGKENGVPYEDDLYLDVVVRPDGKIILLDEKELKSALDKYEITNEEYTMAYDEANKLINLLNGNVENLKVYTDKYLTHFTNYVNSIGKST